jgi:hypothetical protein
MKNGLVRKFNNTLAGIELPNKEVLVQNSIDRFLVTEKERQEQ